ncbi:MAG TPA: hypothetical protein VIJ79_07630 [Acidobacteriaceae bacterium]
MRSDTKPSPARRPPELWARAFASLTTREGKSIREFYQQTSRHYAKVLRDLYDSAETVDDNDLSLDFFIDERDELEVFAQDNRYFALVRAAGLYERVCSRLILRAIDAGLLTKEPFVRNNFVQPRLVKSALLKLGSALPDGDIARLTILQETRNKILHEGGRVWIEGSTGEKFMEQLRFSHEEVLAALDLTIRACHYQIDTFRKKHCAPTRFPAASKAKFREAKH